MADPKNEFTNITKLQPEAQGEPGKRTFRIIVDSESSSASMWMEKEQLFQLAVAIQRLIATLPEDLSGPALAAWSAAGGTVEFERLVVDWGDLEIAAEGTLTLDKELRLEAAFSAEIAGYGGLLDGLAESGRMKPRDASFAKTFLNLMAKKKAGRRVIEAPITAQGGTLFIGPLPLFKLAPIY